MRNHIIFFSGGKSSFSVAHLVKERYPEDNILLYFTDTLWEDEDLYRFIYEASDKLELPMLYHAVGLTPPQLMVKERFMYNSRVGNCSKKLKMEPAAKFLKKGIEPEIVKWHNKEFLKSPIEPLSEGFADNTTLYFGIGWEEAHREGPIRANWKPFQVDMLLIDEVIDNDEILALHNIRQPRLYDMQFAHNNCKGRCVKAGQGHYKNLLMKDEKTFNEIKEQEIVISFYIRYTKQAHYTKENDRLFDEVYEFMTTGKKTLKLEHVIKTNWHTKNFNLGGRNAMYSFIKTMSLEELERKPVQVDIWDIGGCGCFIDYENDDKMSCEL